MIIKANKLKDIFHNYSIQINTEAVNLINDEIQRLIENKAMKCKEGNIKRLTPELYYYTK